MQDAIKKCIEQLSLNPRHPSLNTHKIRGSADDVWEAYVDRKNRVTFHYDDEAIVLRNNCNHDIIDRGAW